MNFVTYIDPSRPWWFCVMVATGASTAPTPDGGPWAVEYEVPSRARLAECSQNAEDLLQRMLRDCAPNVLHEAVALGWFSAASGGSRSR